MHTTSADAKSEVQRGRQLSGWKPCWK